MNDQKFSGVKNVSSYYHNGLFKYTSGHFATNNQAERNLSAIRNKGFKDAFIVAFHKNERISISEAKRLISEE